MIRLLTLGGLAVESGETAPAAARFRLQGMALLARLAVAGARGVSRDKLVGCFWPERDERHARHSLSQTLHRLRCDLCSGPLVLGTSMLRLDPSCITSDVADFEEAVRRGDLERAVELYAGPFLDGIYLAGASQWQQWVDGERQRLAELHARCVREMARAAAARGEHRAAAALWRRLAAADPLDSDTVLALAEALDAAGDRAGALREVKAHEAAARSELGMELEPALREFVARARSMAPANRPSAPTASELCARGRQCIQTFTADGFAEATRHLERALTIDPAHAEAHVTLGALLILLSQADPGGDARASGVRHCRRAIELDPTHAEAHLWLGCAAMHDERYEEAEAHAERGLALDPNVYFHNHFLGWIYMADALKTGSRKAFDRCVEAYRRAIALLPDEETSLIQIGPLYAYDGQYEMAEQFLERALETERTPSAGLRMSCARTLLGTVQLHHGMLEIARANLEQALVEYADAPQLFAPYVKGLTLCALGDAERLDGRNGEAAVYYARAAAVIDAVPGLIGAGYLMVRLQTRLAVAYQRLGMRREAGRSARMALALTRTRSGYSFGWCWLVSEGELHYDWAVYHATRGDRTAMLAALASATSFGWRETTLPNLEPAFGAYRADGEFRRLLDEAAARPPLAAIVAMDNTPDPARAPA